MRFNLGDYLEATEAPHWLTHNSAWIYHIPLAAILIKMLRPRTFVELGTFRGDSYMAFCQAAAKIRTGTQCTAVDNWTGDAHAGFYGPEILRELKATHDPLYGSFSRLLRAEFPNALPQFAENSIDLLHIDGHHTYEAVKQDFEQWLPKLSNRAVVLFHDTQVRERDFGVWKLWEELTAKYPHFNIPYGCGLGMLAVGRDVPRNFVDFLCEFRGDDGAAIVTQMQTLGIRIELSRTVMALVNDLHNSQTVLNDWRKWNGQPVIQTTPDVKAAWTNPRQYSMAVTNQTRDMVVESLLMRQNAVALENQLAARIGVVREVVVRAQATGV